MCLAYDGKNEPNAKDKCAICETCFILPVAERTGTTDFTDAAKNQARISTSTSTTPQLDTIFANGAKDTWASFVERYQKMKMKPLSRKELDRYQEGNC